MTDRDVVVDAFAGFVRDRGPALKHALMAALGPEMGMDAAAEALAYGWEHRDRVSAMENLAGYLYRLGQPYLLRPPRPALR